MVITTAKIAFLLLVWAFFMGLIGLGLTIPTILLVIGSVLYLLA